MFSRFFKNSLVLLSLLTTSSFVYANTFHHKIRCPFTSSIRQSAEKIDSYDKYTTWATTSNPAFFENGLAWKVIVVTGIVQGSPSDAIALGKELIKKTNVRLDRHADRNFVCGYGPANIIAIGEML